MSTLTRYLVFHYLRNFGFLLFLCLALVICSKIESLAQLVAAGTPISIVLKFFLSFFPLFFSLTLPLASLCSTFLFTYSLSQNGELLALRANGFSLWKLLTPFFLMSLFLTIGMSYVASEWETRTHTERRLLYKEMLSINPFKLLSVARGMPLYTPPRNPINESGKEEVLFLRANEGQMMVYLAPPPKRSSLRFYSPRSTLISTIHEQDRPPSLVLENTHESSLDASGLHSLVNKKTEKLKNDYLSLGMLRLYREQLKKRELPFDDSTIKYHLNMTLSEYARRFSLGLLTATLTFLGFTLGICNSRHYPISRFLSLLFYTTACLLCYFTAHGIESQPAIAIPLYLLPHAAIYLFCLYDLKKIEEGRLCS